MRCPNCGYEYPDSLVKCPSCGTEHTKLAQELQQDTLDSLTKESHHIRRNFHKELRQNTDRKVAKSGLIGLTAIIGVLVLVLAGSFVLRLIRTNHERRNLELLETYLQEENYAALEEKMDSISDRYESTYDKYRPVADMYEDLCYAEESFLSYQDFAESGHLSQKQLAESLSWSMAPYFQVLMDARLGLNDQLILGNEAALEAFEAQAYAILTEDFHLTEEEIAEVINSKVSIIYSEKLLPLASDSHERIQKAR